MNHISLFFGTPNACGAPQTVDMMVSSVGRGPTELTIISTVCGPLRGEEPEQGIWR